MTIERILRGTPLHGHYVALRTSKPVLALTTRDYWRMAARRARDGLRTLPRPSLWLLHRRLRRHLSRQRASWPHRPYAFGYFYQGWERIKVSGDRPTEVRFEQYRLKHILRRDMRVLDVGANAGFLAMMVAERVQHVDAVEINSFQVAIGEEVASWLGIQNISLHAADFMHFDLSQPYDLVMSFANHKTVDGNMAPDLRRYFEKLHAALKPGGVLLFETHCFDNDNPEFHSFISALGDIFIQERRDFLENGPRTGGDRYFYVFRKT